MKIIRLETWIVSVPYLHDEVSSRVARGGVTDTIVNTGGNLGGLIAPVATAYVATRYGWTSGFLVASVVCLTGVALWLGIRLKDPLESDV